MVLKSRKVLVTGACGFIGSHLVERLLKEGCKVRAFVFYNARNSWGWLDTLPKGRLKRIEIFAGDVRDPNGVRAAARDVDMVFHLAALIGIPFSYHSPDSYVDTNVKGTLNILQACRDFKTEKVIITSTSEVYGTANYVPIDERHPLQGQSPYSATKIAADKIAESFYLSFGVPVVIARPFNTYGPRQSGRAVIPTVITQALSDMKEINLGNIFPTRDLTYVSDTCEGFVEIAKSDKMIGMAVNICSGQEISVRDLAKLIFKIMGRDKKIKNDRSRQRPENSEVGRLLGDNTLIRSVTGWRPKCGLERGLSETIKWFRDKKNSRIYKPDIYSV